VCFASLFAQKVVSVDATGHRTDTDFVRYSSSDAKFVMYFDMKESTVEFEYTDSGTTKRAGCHLPPHPLYIVFCTGCSVAGAQFVGKT